MLRNISKRVLTEMNHFLETSTKLLNNMYGVDNDNLEPQIQGQEQGIKGQEENKKVVPYESKYLERYNKLSSNGVSPNKNNFVIENTPVGNVVMKYDVDKESFFYYADHIMPFRHLETVSMKYVCMFDCKQIYVERHEEIIPIQANQPKTTKDILNQARNPTPVKKEKFEVKMNRYSNGGRFSNFNFLQPVAKHITDKKQLMKFSDFKTKTMLTNK